jgi:hypothetical protein
VNCLGFVITQECLAYFTHYCAHIELVYYAKHPQAGVSIQSSACTVYIQRLEQKSIAVIRNVNVGKVLGKPMSTIWKGIKNKARMNALKKKRKHYKEVVAR